MQSPLDFVGTSPHPIVGLRDKNAVQTNVVPSLGTTRSCGNWHKIRKTATISAGIRKAKMYCKVTAIGNLGKDPELRYTPQGTAVCNFSLATTERRKNKEGDWAPVTTWWKVTVWGKQGENAANYLNSGSKVMVEGSFVQSEWTDREGKTRTSLEINATNVLYLDKKGDNERTERQPTQQAQAPEEAVTGLPANDDIPF